jgi:hypothetical protein
MGGKYKSCQLQEMTGATLRRIQFWLEQGKLDKPSKDASGDFLWAEEHLARIRQLESLSRARRARARPVGMGSAAVPA